MVVAERRRALGLTQEMLADLADVSRSMAMNLYGRANRLKRSDFIDAGERLGVGARPMRRMIDEVCDASTAWIPRCAEIGFTDRDTERLIALLTARAESLTGS